MTTSPLWDLSCQLREKKHLESIQSEMCAQQKKLNARLTQLEQALRSEQADVDRLERHSLSAFFYQLTGQIGDKLEQERQQAAAARLKYETARQQAAALEQDLRQIQAKLAPLQGCEKRYQRTLEQTLRQLQKSDTPLARRLLELEADLALLKCQKKELREARSAGIAAQETTQELLSVLESAEGLGTWDLFVDGGFMLEAAKHSELDNAQELVEQLQVQLQRFRSELADVEIDASIQAAASSFLQFADYFFDSFFADWAVLDHINQAQKQASRAASQIQQVLHTLSRLESETTARITDIRQQMEQLALENSCKGADHGDQ